MHADEERHSSPWNLSVSCNVPGGVRASAQGSHFIDQEHQDRCCSGDHGEGGEAVHDVPGEGQRGGHRATLRALIDVPRNCLFAVWPNPT